MDKYLKTIWLIIGIIFLLILPIIGYNLIKDTFFSPDYPSSYEEPLIVGEEQKKAIREGKMIQGLVYDRIERIDGTLIRVLPLSAKKFNTPKDIDRFYAEFEETRSRAGDMNMSSIFGNVNLIFLDENYNVINTLLDRKAYISQYASPGSYSYEERNKLDPTVKNIAYLIAFDDSNADGLLNEADHHDLFISDIDGSNLKQITRGIEVLEFEFMRDNKELYIVFQKRDSVVMEYKRKLFSKYKIEEDTLIEFVGLQRNILELEKKLMIDTLDNP
jgi:hypothetical protein